MFLSKIEVKNFRCLNDIKIDLDNSTIFIGENNSGKTALLDLIRNILGRVTQTAFFNEYDYYLDESNSIIYKCNSLLTEAIIKCINMTNEEYEELQKNIQNLEKDIFDQSFKNLKKSLEIIAN